MRAQELPRAAATPSASVDDPAQGSEQPRRTVHFVQHHERVRIDLAELLDVGEAGEGMPAIGRYRGSRL